MEKQRENGEIDYSLVMELGFVGGGETEEEGGERFLAFFTMLSSAVRTLTLRILISAEN